MKHRGPGSEGEESRSLLLLAVVVAVFPIKDTFDTINEI